ncbi:MAG TPA: carboxypeptidase regulatory-like domain-containing protein [Gemmatimonadales bacterium]|nr:carboxypeptidase regulatory-like domain-containing protein [Gemmatimonadales bacterium]
MRWIVRSSCALVAAAVFSMLSAGAALAQGVTTGAISGIVTDSLGTPLEGARVVAVHGPSGTTYAAGTRADGRFTLPGMRVGGPYRVTVSLVGYRQGSQDGISVTLGQTSDLRFALRQVTVELEAITVTATPGTVFSSERTGAATTVSKEQIAHLPTISRRVEDLLRLTPQYSPMSFGFSFAGQDNRLNNMTIDGSYFNNSFGLAGQPGDRTGVTPISMDALEQIQVSIAPYDVRQGNFVGAGINMVTKSGANNFSGSVFYNARNNSFVGTDAGPNKFDPGTFKYSDIGVSLGGPIVRNRLFFFSSFENDGQTAPGTTFRANTGGETVAGNVTRVLASDLDALSTYLRTNFNYTAGPYQGYDFKVPSTRFLARLDYNLSDHNKLSLRYNLLNSSSDILVSNSGSLGLGNRRSSLFSLNFANSNYAILENIRSIVGEWNSSFGGNKSNNLIVGYNTSDESRRIISPPWFPLVEIFQGTSNYTTFGFEPFTPDNKLLYHSYQLQDNFTFYLPKHSVTFGVSVEKYHSTNVFFPGAQSVYVYNSLADFYTDANDYLANPTRTVSPVTLRRFQVRYGNIPGQAEPVQPLDVLYSGAYVQDEWRPSRNLTLTAGLRIDAPKFKNTAYANAVADTMTFRDVSGAPVRYSSGSLPGVNALFSPRFGFNYDVGGEQKTQIRGGTGIFTGRPAYVWISNQIGNTGVLTGFIQQDNTTAFPFNPNPDAYKPTTVTGAPAASFQLALTDPKFRFPQLWRSNIAIDQRLPWGMTATVEYLYSKDVNGIAYLNANLPAPQSAFAGPDGRPRWTSNRIYPAVSDATVLTNQGRGHSWNAAASVERAFQSGLFAKVGYSYGKSLNTVDAGSIASGSWTGNFIAVDPNNPVAANSQFAPGDRIFAAASYTRDFLGIGPTSIGVYFDGRSAGTDSYIFSNDMNGDGATNDLIYIARNVGEMNFLPLTVGTGPSAVTYTPAQQAAAWEAFINQDSYLRDHRGEYAGRNAIFRPKVYRADVSISQDVGRNVAGRPNSLQIRLDMLNFSNFLNKNWGVAQGLVTNRPLVSAGVDVSGASQYRLATVGTSLISKSFQKIVSTTDVWRIQLGVRYMLNW